MRTITCSCSERHASFARLSHVTRQDVSGRYGDCEYYVAISRVDWQHQLIIIIINFCDAYILRNLSSEAQQNKIFEHNREQAREAQTRDTGRFMVEMQFEINVLSFFRKIAIVSGFQSDGECIPDPGHSDRESTFTKVQFSFRHNKLL